MSGTRQSNHEPEELDVSEPLDVGATVDATPGEAGVAEPAEEALRREVDELRARWQRAQADYQNLKRRTQSDLDGMLRRNMQPLLESLLLVIDHLDMALAAPVTSEDARGLAVGVRMTRDQLVRALEEEDVRSIREDGEFDPELHQAVASVPDADGTPGAIVDVVRRGYSWRGAVLRPARVRVTAAPTPTTPTTESD
jgi:molecular chaperone GrpE